MPDDSVTCWTISVPKQTDAEVRTFLAHRGLKDADLPQFIVDAVRWRVFDQTLTEARDAFAGQAPAAVEAMIEDAVTAARSET